MIWGCKFQSQFGGIWGCFDCIWVWEIGENLQCARARARCRFWLHFQTQMQSKQQFWLSFQTQMQSKRLPGPGNSRARTADFGLPGPGSCFDCIWVWEIRPKCAVRARARARARTADFGRFPRPRFNQNNPRCHQIYFSGFYGGITFMGQVRWGRRITGNITTIPPDWPATPQANISGEVPAAKEGVFWLLAEGAGSVK